MHFFDSFSTPTAIEGFFLGLSLIMPLGAQNMYVLRQGALGRYPYLVAAICAISDCFLILLGALGVGSILSQTLWLKRLVVIGGLIFLLYYGIKSFQRVWQREHTPLSEQELSGSLRTVIFSSLAFSLLNPHAILDTTVLLGARASQQGNLFMRLSFATGACIASILWFFVLVACARLIRPLFHRPLTGAILDGIAGVLMFWIAAMILQAEFSLF